jgi:hypothetical protein
MFLSPGPGYAGDMDILPLPPPHTLTVLCAPAPAGEPVIELIAGLALRGPLTILDGGNCFPAYRLIRAVRGRTEDLSGTLACIFLRRAFTCHQMLALLEGTPSRPQPYILLDLLATFYDEQVPEPESRRLLESCLRQVERLAQSAPVLVTVAPPRTPERSVFVEQVCARAVQLYVPELPAPPCLQPALF